MKTKLEMAHEWFMKHSESPSFMYTEVEQAWQYADAMQAEADKREKEDQEKLKQDDINHHDALVEIGLEEQQPDWSQAPNRAMYWAMDGCGQCNWYEREPEVFGSQWDWGSVIEQTDTGYDYQGDWRNSLRKRPK